MKYSLKLIVFLFLMASALVQANGQTESKNVKSVNPDPISFAETKLGLNEASMTQFKEFSQNYSVALKEIRLNSNLMRAQKLEAYEKERQKYYGQLKTIMTEDQMQLFDGTFNGRKRSDSIEKE